MKSFSSTASRRRQQVAILHKVGWGTSVFAGVWLIAIVIHPAKHADVPSLPEIRSQRAPSANHATEVAVFASRPLRPPPPPPPVVVASAPAPPKPIPPPEVELVATMVNPGKTPSAFVRSKAAGKLVIVEVGKQIDGALVKEISDGQLTLELSGKDFVLKVGRKPL